MKKFILCLCVMSAAVLLLTGLPVLDAAEAYTQTGQDDIIAYVEGVRAKLHAGISRDDVGREFGVEAYRVMKAINEGGSNYLYRYELLKDSDYEFINEYDLDTVDIEGIAEGKLRVVVFIDYGDQDRLESYSIYYLGLAGVYELRDGSSGGNLIYRIE